MKKLSSDSFYSASLEQLVALKRSVGSRLRESLARGLSIVLLVAFLPACSQPVKETATSAKTQIPSEYHIQPGDRLFVSVWGEEVLQQGVVVQPDGGLSFPLAGQIQAEGLSVAQLEAELNKRLSPYIPQPAVSVSLIEPLGYRIYVVGRVSRPGEYVLSRQVDVLQALALAGGRTRTRAVASWPLVTVTSTTAGAKSAQRTVMR